MGRQFRPPRAGTGTMLVTPRAVAVSSTLVAIPNYGVTDVTTWAAGDYVLAPPEEGVRKTIVSVTSTSVARVIRSATDASVKIGHGGATQIQAAASTGSWCIVLLGINSTQWAVENQYPPATTVNVAVIATS